MRKLHIILLTLVVLIGVLVTPAAFAQDTLSTGCTALASDFSLDGASFTGDFSAGESITFVVDADFASGDTYTVTVGGVDVVVDHDQESYTHTFDADATGVTIAVTVTSGTFTVSVACDDAGESGDFTLCHYPPGNPAAAHTITVGSQNAFETHQARHDDTPGECPPGIDSRTDDDASGLVIYIILDADDTDDEEITEVIAIYGECEDGECISLVEILIDDVVALVGTLDVEGYVEFDAGDDDGYTVRIYYLGYQDRNGDGTFHEVFQINIYYNDVLVNDDVLVLVADDGTVSWELNPDIGVDISILFSGGDDDCDEDGADDIPGTADDEICDGSS